MHAYQHQPEPATTMGDHQPDPQPQPQPRPLWAVPEGGSAGACAPAHARVAEEINLNSQPDPQPPAPTDSDHQAGVAEPKTPVLQRLAQWAHPPNIKAWMPPTWEQIKWRGEHGEHVAREGWPRSGSQAWKRVYLSVRVVQALVDWIFESGSRAAVAFVLYALLAHLSFMSWLPWPGFLP